MGILYGFLIVVEVVVCALLIAIVFMQKAKGGMGGSAFGGGAGEAIFGSRMGNVLTKATVVLGVIFLMNTLVLTILTARGSVSSVMDRAGPVAAPRGASPADPATAPADLGWVEDQMPFSGDVQAPWDVPVPAENVQQDVVTDVAPISEDTVPAADPSAE